MTPFNDARIRHANSHSENRTGSYVLYWSQMYRRLRANHALDYALHWATRLKKPLVVYEGLKLNYPWASARFHQFILEGMRDNVADAKKLGAHYWPFVETPGNAGRGLVRKLCDQACLLVTDDYPQFIIPAQIRAVAEGVTIAVHAVDGNGIVPLSLLGPPTKAAAHLRPKIHKLFTEAWENRTNLEPDFSTATKTKINPPFDVWHLPKDIGEFVKSLPIDQNVPAIPNLEGGRVTGLQLIADFVETKLPRYGDHRSQPDDPVRNAASGLSAHLHYGHISIQDVCDAVFASVKNWTTAQINLKTRNKDDFFCRDANVNSFLDEAITWRDVGFQWHFTKAVEKTASGPKSWQDSPDDTPSYNFASCDFSPITKAGTLPAVLPEWAWESLKKHTTDSRAYTHTLEEFEAAKTHDPLWNSAQHELIATGRIHNYLRMLWGKKVLEWSATPEDAYRVLEHLNNKYAIDGRDPNSYTGIFWCFGLFDRPWPPERKIFGSIRYMTSDSTAKKFKLQGYYDYVRRLPRIADVRGGQVTAIKRDGLF